MEIFTIGFTQKTAEQFFGILRDNRIEQLLDIRLSNSGQLAGYTKAIDLRYFLRELCNVEYLHEPLLTPTKELLTDYRHGKRSWMDYERIFNALLEEREIATRIPRDLFARRTVLLCSEATPDQCHRRLIAEYLRDRWGDLTITHL